MAMLNRKAVRSFILELCETTRPSCGFTRVSEETYDYLERRVRMSIRDAMHSHPSIGKTVRLGK